MSANGMRIELAETHWAGHATELARDAAAAGTRLIVAAGGDGTIAEVAKGVAGTGAHLGIIPLGTANVLAHELALPFSPRAVAAALAFGRTCLLWPGLAQGPGAERLFVQMLGVGLDAQVVHAMSLPLKRLLGKGAYVAQTGDRRQRQCRGPGRRRPGGQDPGIDPQRGRADRRHRRLARTRCASQ